MKLIIEGNEEKLKAFNREMQLRFKRTGLVSKLEEEEIKEKQSLVGKIFSQKEYKGDRQTKEFKSFKITK